MTDKTWGEEAHDQARAMSAEREFQEWQRQLAMRAAANDMREERKDPTKFETWGDFFDWACEGIDKLRSEEPIYPYMACSRQYEPMDPLEGCSECRGVGYHTSIPNPDWDNPELHHRRWNNVMRKMEGDL